MPGLWVCRLVAETPFQFASRVRSIEGRVVSVSATPSLARYTRVPLQNYRYGPSCSVLSFEEPLLIYAACVVSWQMQDEYGFDPAHVGGDMRPSKVPMYNASRASTAYYKFSEDPPQRAPVGDRSLPNYWSDRVPGLPARVSPAMRALEGIAPGAGSSRSEDDQVRRTRASPPGRRWTTRSTHSTSDDMGEVLWSEAGRYWGGAPFPPPYPFPPEYSTWMGSRPAMDAPSVDPNLHLWLRHVQETMRRYPAQEGPMAPYPRHFPALPGRVGPHPFGAPLHEELRGNRRPKTPQRSGGDEVRARPA